LEEFNFPSVTLITVNFNGKRFLNNLFKSIEGLNYPKNKISTIMVDNGSTDGSQEFVGMSFPWVKTIRLEKNLGYAGGNNAGICAAESKYAALINNDCTVEKDWLLCLVKRAEELSQKGIKTGAISSKVLFYYSYMPVVIIVENGTVEISGINIEGYGKKNLECNNLPNPGDKNPSYNNMTSKTDVLKSIKYLSGCSCAGTGSAGSGPLWQLSGYALTGFPVTDAGNDMAISMDIRHTSGSSVVNFYIKKLKENINSGKTPDLYNCDELVPVAQIKAGSSKKNVKIIIGRDMYVSKNDMINSCGLEVNKSFYARDRGSNSFDLGQYAESDEVFAPCGSSLIINREMLDDTGVFEKSFFTYYEDVDLFWRARLRGWKVFYEPGSVARHLHCGTGVEWSYSFTYHVLRNRLLTIFKNGWFLLWFKNTAVFYISSVAHTAHYLAALIKGKKQHRPDIKARLRISIELLYLFAAHIASRFKIRLGKKITDTVIKKMLIDF